jgi:LemA protein
MNRKRIGVIAAAIVVIILLFFGIGYNSFVNLDSKVNFTWSEIQNAYQRRADLIPNIVKVVKGSTEYERTTLQQLTEARAKAASTNTATVNYNTYQQQETAQADVTNNLNRVIAVVEKYPELQSTNQFKTLQAQLEGTERRIKFARKDFNDAVYSYNVKRRTFPWNIVGSVLGFKQKEGFTAAQGTQNAPEVKFN